jgi:hypothetical protein
MPSHVGALVLIVWTSARRGENTQEGLARMQPCSSPAKDDRALIPQEHGGTSRWNQKLYRRK